MRASSIAVVEFSAERDVRVLGWAIRFVRARRDRNVDDAFHEVEAAWFQYLGTLEDAQSFEEQRALVHAFTRLSSALAVQAAVVTDQGPEDALRIAYNGLATSSIEHDPADPWGWADRLEDDEGNENVEEQLRYLRGEDEEPA